MWSRLKLHLKRWLVDGYRHGMTTVREIDHKPRKLLSTNSISNDDTHAHRWYRPGPIRPQPVERRNKTERRSSLISRKTDWQVGMHLRQRAVKSNGVNCKTVKSAFQAWHAAAAAVIIPESPDWVRSSSFDWRWQFMMIILLSDRYDRFWDFMWRKFSGEGAEKGGIDAGVEFNKHSINRNADGHDCIIVCKWGYFGISWNFHSSLFVVSIDILTIYCVRNVFCFFFSFTIKIGFLNAYHDKFQVDAFWACLCCEAMLDFCISLNCRYRFRLCVVFSQPRNSAMSKACAIYILYTSVDKAHSHWVLANDTHHVSLAHKNTDFIF